MSLFGWVRYSACFVDINFDLVGFKVISRRTLFKGLKKKDFEYNGGIYHIKPNAFKVMTSLKTSIFFDNDIFIYQIGNPDPLTFIDGKFQPFMDAEVYKARLSNKMVRDLNSVAMGGIDFKKLLPWLLGGLLLVAIIYYFVNNPASAAETVEPASTVIRGGV